MESKKRASKTGEESQAKKRKLEEEEEIEEENEEELQVKDSKNGGDNEAKDSTKWSEENGKSDKDSEEKEEPITNEFKLKNLRLKTIIRENHGTEIHNVCFNLTDERFTNMVATVCDTQANIYDNQHFGKNLDLYMHYSHSQNSDKKDRDKQLRNCVWMRSSGSENELEDDAYLALAAEESIHIIDVKRCQVTILLKGHSNQVVDVVAHPKDPALLLSVSKDSTVRLWNVHGKEPCLLTRAMNNPTAAAFSPSGTEVIVGTTTGSFYLWNLDQDDEEPQILRVKDKKHQAGIDCVRFLSDNQIISKSVDGKIVIWDKTTQQAIRDFKVPSMHKSTSCKFDVDSNKEFLCVGNGEGVVYIFKLATGKQLSRLEYKRSKQPIRACAFSHDLNYLVFVNSEAHIWRYDYVDPKDVPPDQN